MWQCLREYFDMVSSIERDMAMCWHHFRPQGLPMCHQISRALYGAVLAVSSVLWRQVACPLSWFPFKLVGLTLDNFGDAFAETAEELFSCSKCCVDSGMTGRIINHCGGQSELLQCPSLIAALTAWSRHRKIGNMSCERLLKLVTSSSRRRCTVRRLCAASFIAQVSQRHAAAGGEDITKVTRRKLLDMGVPIKARKHKRSSKVKSQDAGWSRQFAAFANERQKVVRSLRPGAKKTLGTREEYLERMRKLKAAWRQGDRLVRSVDDMPNAAVGYSDLIGDRLWGTSTREAPMHLDIFNKEIAETAGGGSSGSVGLTARMQPARDRFSSRLIVKDMNAVPASYQTTVDDRCCRKHPGHCRRHETPELRSCHEFFCRLVQQWPRGTLLRLRGQDARGREFAL